MYIAIDLYNFIKSHLGNKKDIYYTPINISDNASSNSSISIIQSSLIQINRLKDRIAAEM